MSRRYRAFISYSHQDEAWARWLQRALESYRFPKDLVGQPARHGKVPRRFRPVFRDREDFSSATDLGAEVRRTLEDSDALIIICSPSSANSRWVNEEIEVFQSLGRSEDIHCVIVDGDPASEAPGQNCFPPALRAHETEPLAVDVRPWADGRLLAKLKLLAGILGLRLDDLRRRDLQRRHRIWAVSAGAAFLVALVTTVLAVLAIQASIEADRQRVEAEQMAAFLANLPGQVDQAGRLELMESLGAEAREWLDRVDPEEFNDETLKVLATVQRNDGDMQSRRGDLVDALAYYQGSLESHEDLARRHPDDPETLYELGNAQFYVGQAYYQLGDYESADRHFSRYLDLARNLARMEPDNVRWVMELAYGHGNLGILESRKAGADTAIVLSMLSESRRYIVQARELEPDNLQFIEDLYEIDAHLADALLRLCDLGAALDTRIASETLMSELARAHPGNFDHQTRWSHALMGLANVQARVGLTAEALTNANQSARIATTQAEAEPGNTELRWHALRKTAEVAALQDSSGQDEAAWQILQTVERDMAQVLENQTAVRVEWISSYALMLGRMAKLAAERGDHVRAAELEARAVERFRTALQASPEDYLTRRRLTELSYPAWDSARLNPDDDLQKALLDFSTGEVPAEGCEEADIAARQAWLRENHADAERFTRYLLSNGYWEAEFLEFCRRAGLCEERPGQGS